MSKDKNDPRQGNHGGKNDDRSSQSNERRQTRDTRFKKGRSGNVRGRPPKKKETREDDNPAIHHLVKKVNLTSANGKIFKGRVLDLVCMSLANMALNGNFKALDRLIELAGGSQSIAFMTTTFFRSDRLKDDEPNPGGDDSGPEDSDPDKGGSGPNSFGGGPTVQVTEDDLDSSDLSERDEGDQGAERTRHDLAGGDALNLNDETIWNRAEAARRRLADQLSAIKQRDTDKGTASQPKPVRSSKRKEEIAYFRDGKLIDDSEAIMHALADPNYWSDPAYRPYDCPSRTTHIRAKYELHRCEQVEAEKESAGFVTKQEFEAGMETPETQEIAGVEGRGSPAAGAIPLDLDSSERRDRDRLLLTCNDNKRRLAVEI